MTKKELLAKGFSEEQIRVMIESGIEVTDPEPTLEELKSELEGAQKRIKELNKENEKYRLKSNELDSLKSELEEKINTLASEKDSTLTEKEKKEKQLEQYQVKLNELEKVLQERDSLKERLESFEIKEQEKKEALLSKISEDKRAKFEDAPIEIIEEFVNMPKNSVGVGKPQTGGDVFKPQTLQELANSKYQSKNQVNFVK